ncbi:MAG: flippase-like domain-containing protein [Thermoplasmatales archaeon]|nr:MAG: flippase-like domain-containing protein [Thermoplasmatales archaeon]
MKTRIFEKAKKFLPLIGIVILIIITLNLDVEKIIDAFLLINPIYIIFALSLTIPRVLIRNYGWQLIQKEQKIKISYFQSLKCFLIGYFYASWTPGFVGQLMRVPYMKEKTGEPYGKLFINTLIEVTVRQVAIYSMIVIGLLLIVEEFSDIEITRILPFIIALLITVQAGIILYFIKKERGEKVLNFFIKFLVPKKLKNSSFKFVDTFYKDFPRISRLIIPTFIGLISWIIIFSQEYIIVYALGANIPYLSFLLLYPVANMAGYIPVTFAGLGFRELTSIIIFSTLFGVGEEMVLVFTLLGFIITDVVTGFVGFLVSLTEARKTDIIGFKKMLEKD